METGAGIGAGFVDDAYREAGAEIVGDSRSLFQAADALLQVRTLGVNPSAAPDRLNDLRPGSVVIGMADPLGNPAAAAEYAKRKLTLFALELLPRISRAQSMDVLSSMATVTGDKAALLAAFELPKLFPLLMTAAGTQKPAKVLVIGAGVAGLQAIATSRRLGAVVQAYDVRPAAREQILSIGGSVVEIDLPTDNAEAKGGYAKTLSADQQQRLREELARVAAGCDVVITTAAVPGGRSPLLLTADAVARMQPGSVIVDLAAEKGGNCELTRPDQTVEHRGVKVLGPTNLPSAAPFSASQMYSTNLVNFLSLIVKDGALAIDTEDEVVRDTLVTRHGEITNPLVRRLLQDATESLRSSVT